MRPVILTLRFLLELASLAALAVWGASVDAATGVRVVLGIGAPVLAAAAWGRFAAPTSSTRLADPARLGFEVVFFGVAGAALVAAGHAPVGIALSAVAVADSLALRAVGE